VVACCLVREHTSLKAFWHLARNWQRVVEKRRAIQARRCVDDEYMASWFRYRPVSRKAPARTMVVGQSAQPENGTALVRGRAPIMPARQDRADR
jgi:hypothetical protein